MIDDGLIVDLKKKYQEIYSVSLGSDDFIFRSLTFSEIDELALHGDDFSSAEGEEQVVRSGVVWPEDVDWDSLPAGTVSVLAEEIMDISIIASPAEAQEMLDVSRQGAEQDVRKYMKAFVLEAQPAYKEEELDDLTFRQLVDKVTLSEVIMKVRQAVLGGGDVLLDIVDPTAPESEEPIKPGETPGMDPIAQQLHEALGS